MKQHHTFLVPTSYPLFWFEEHAPQMHMPPWVMEKAAIIIPAAKQNMRSAFRSGVPVALGTDAGVYPHGENGGEFWAMVTLGMSPVQALQAGTANAAELMGLSDRLGCRAASLANPIGDRLLRRWKRARPRTNRGRDQSRAGRLLADRNRHVPRRCKR